MLCTWVQGTPLSLEICPMAKKLTWQPRRIVSSHGLLQSCPLCPRRQSCSRRRRLRGAAAEPLAKLVCLLVGVKA